MRAMLEEKILAKHFNNFSEYKNKSSFMLPFLG
jgi:hypothetical protein